MNERMQYTVIRELLLRGLVDGPVSTAFLVDRVDRTSSTRINTHYAREELLAMVDAGLVRVDASNTCSHRYELTDAGRLAAQALGTDEGHVLDFGLLRRKHGRVVVDESVGTYSAVLILAGGAVVWRPLVLDGLSGDQLEAVEARLVQELRRVRHARGYP